jgi:hypothetical protein
MTPCIWLIKRAPVAPVPAKSQIENLSIKGLVLDTAISAFVAKYWALRCQIQTDITQKLKNHMKGLFDEHEKNADRLLSYFIL